MRKIYTLIFVLVATLGWAQNKNLNKAKELFEAMRYKEAAVMYNTHLENHSEPTAALLKNAADANFYVQDSKHALKWYERLYALKGEQLSEVEFLRYQQSLRGTENYAKADELVKIHLRQKGQSKQIDAFNAQRKYNDSLSKTASLYTIKNLAINSSKSDFGAAFYADKVIYASSKDTTQVNSKLYSWNQQPFLSLYAADRNAADGSLFREQHVFPEIRSAFHEATVAFSPDYKTIYYTTNTTNAKHKPLKDNKGFTNLQIIKGSVENGKIVKTQKIAINNIDYSVGHPAVSPDGKWLFFVSDMPGGYGETDIYVAEIKADGDVQNPVNLGANINTVGRDMFPFFVGDRLFFASEGHYGFGGLDIYMAMDLGKLNFGTAKNLGSPINSNADDFGFIMDSKLAYGYFSSNRVGGQGDDDIYSFTKAPDVCLEIISGVVTTAKSGLPLEGATIKAYDEFDDYIGTVQSDAQGKYAITVPCGSKVRIEASKANHSTEQQMVPLTAKHGKETPNINFALVNYADLIKIEDKQEKIDINPIFFDFDKADITPQGSIELDRVIYAMTKFPNLKIKIESHTDSRGKDAYNLRLSDARAKSTQQYIISKGIDSSRILSAIGYGETRLRNKCKNGVKCTEEEHFANRRSDFIIIEK